MWRLINVFQPKYVVTLSKSLLENLQILFIIILPSTLLTLLAVLYKDHYLPYLSKKTMIVKNKIFKKLIQACKRQVHLFYYNTRDFYEDKIQATYFNLPPNHLVPIVYKTSMSCVLVSNLLGFMAIFR